MWDVLVDSKVIAAGDSYTTIRNLKLYSRHPDRAVQFELTGNGSVDIAFHTSVDGRSWIDNGIKIKAITKTHGPGGDGKDIVPVELKLGEFFRAEFTAATATATITAWFVQK